MHKLQVNHYQREIARKMLCTVKLVILKGIKQMMKLKILNILQIQNFPLSIDLVILNEPKVISNYLDIKCVTDTLIQAIQLRFGSFCIHDISISRLGRTV